MIDLYSENLAKPLSVDERYDLHAWLTKVCNMTLFYTHGFLAATITHPAFLPRHDWLPRLFGPDLPNKVPPAELQYYLDLVVRLCAQITSEFDNDAPTFNPMLEVEPRPWLRSEKLAQARDENLRDWSSGYLNGTQFNRAWEALRDFDNVQSCLLTLEQENPTAESMKLDDISPPLTPGQLQQIVWHQRGYLPTLLQLVYRQAAESEKRRTALAAQAKFAA